jgi:hypothetical protein
MPVHFLLTVRAISVQENLLTFILKITVFLLGYVCNVFNDAVSSSNCILPNDWVTVNNKLEKAWKEVVLSLFEVPSQNLPQGLRKTRNT